jgi:CRISPR-associated protein Csx14
MNKKPKHILVSLLGRTPQILTETLYALKIERKIPIAEVRVLTTAEGREAISEHLLHPKTGKFYEFCRDWEIDPAEIKFDSESISVASDLDNEIDIFSQVEKAEPLINLILQELKKLTADQNRVLHCSLAGGRKTMSVYFAFGLQFLGRPQDKLYHVLTQPQEFQNHKDFFYIPPQSRTLLSFEGKKISTANARIELIEVPYVRLRDKISYLFGERELTFDKMVHITQTELEQMPDLPPLTINSLKKCITIGNKNIYLSPIETAIYVYYAKRSKNRSNGISVKEHERYFEYAEGSFFPEQGLSQLLKIYSQIATYGVVDRFKTSLTKGNLDFDRACQYFSRIKRKICSALSDDTLAEFYIISGVGKYGKCYGIKLDKSKIVIVGK